MVETAKINQLKSSKTAFFLRFKFFLFIPICFGQLLSGEKPLKFFFISICFTLSFPLYAEEIKAKFFKIVEHTITTDEIYLHGKKVCRDMNARNASGELAEAIKNDEFMYFDSSVCYLKRIPKGTSATELKQALRQCQESKNSAEVNNGSRSIISHAKDVEKVIKKKNSQKPKANRE